MMRRNLVNKILIMTVILTMLCINAAMAIPKNQKNQQAKLLADFLVTGRGVVAQSLAKFKINDPSLGDKGFTSVYFQQEINKQFLKKTGIDILVGKSKKSLPNQTMNLLKTILESSRKVCEDNQPLINMKGIAFKGFIPASYGRMVADIFNQKTGITIKQTSTRYRNTYNKPDSFETEKLSEMEAPAYPKDQLVMKTSKKYFRLMKPIYIKQGCLTCHGDPKGSKDVAGRTKEGYKVGDLRGAISVLIPLK